MCSNRCANPVRPGLLVLRPDVIPDLGVHDRRRVIFEKDHLQPVGQRRHRVIELAAAASPRARPDRREQQRQQRQPTASARSADERIMEIDYRMRWPARSAQRSIMAWTHVGGRLLQARFELGEARFEIGNRLPQLRQLAGTPPTTSASRGWRWRDSPETNEPGSTELGMPVCAVAIVALADRDVARRRRPAPRASRRPRSSCCRRCRPARRAARCGRSSRRARSARGCRSSCRRRSASRRRPDDRSPRSRRSPRRLRSTTPPICGIL